MSNFMDFSFVVSAMFAAYQLMKKTGRSIPKPKVPAAPSVPAAPAAPSVPAAPAAPSAP